MDGVTDSHRDRRATFFGNANAQVALVCDQLRALPQLAGGFDAVGFSQGGQLLRAVVERCGGESDLRVRNLITLGSQHLGISSLPPCPSDAGPLSACRLMHLSIVRQGLYSTFAQRNIIPAQYIRNEDRILEYLEKNEFLRDINNERMGDDQVGMNAQERIFNEEPEIPRNETYKANFAALKNLVLFRFRYEGLHTLCSAVLSD